MIQRTARQALAGLALLGCLGGTALTASPASAEQAWVRDEIRLNLRTGPSTQNRIVGVVKTGEIPEGYLNPVPPPGVRLADLEVRAVELETELAKVSKRARELGETNEILASQDGEQEAQIKTLTMENMELKAGARYPEWITGALIFASGMLLGAILRSSFAKRAPQRVRL